MKAEGEQAGEVDVETGTNLVVYDQATGFLRVIPIPNKSALDKAIVGGVSFVRSMYVAKYHLRSYNGPSIMLIAAKVKDQLLEQVTAERGPTRGGMAWRRGPSAWQASRSGRTASTWRRATA